MRILFWSETFWPRVGGVENLAVKLLPALLERGYRFLVVTWENIETADVMRYMEIPVHRFPFFSDGREGTLKQVFKHLQQIATLKRAFSPDLIHVNSYGRSVFFHSATSSAYPAPSVLTLHQALADDKILHDSVLGKILKSSEWVTGCSASVLDHARQLDPGIIPRSSVVYNGIEVYPSIPLPLSLNPPRLLCIGRLVAEKGFDLALAAFANVYQKFPCALLCIAGEGPEGEKLRKLATELQLESSVEFIGEVLPERITDLIDQSTLVIVPSRTEGFGLAALEAAMMARPVVAARVGGLSEIVIDGETGLLFNASDPAGMAEKVIFLLEHKDAAVRMGLAAKRRSETEFGWKRYVDNYDELYRRLIMRWARNAQGLYSPRVNSHAGS